MLATSTQFAQLAQGFVRPLSWGLRISWDKAFDDEVTFFILDTSLLDGTDLLAPDDTSVILPWDQYEYGNYDDRVISLETTQELVEPFSVVNGFADFSLNNYDNYFSPNSGSPIDQYILPRRPLRLLMGFNDENLPQFVGLTENVPVSDRKTRVSSVHAIDFLTFLFDKDISETVILEDVSTSDVLDYLFQLIGLLPDQYHLDLAENNIPFFWVEKGTKLGDVISKIVQADLGFLFMNELGQIVYRNRRNFSLTPVDTLNEENIIDYTISTEEKIINSVKITANRREVAPDQSIWASSEVYPVAIGQTIEVWAEFADPVTSNIDPVYSAIEIASSYFTSALAEDGTGAYTDIDFVSIDLFSKAAKLTFENTGASLAYITKVDLWGTPAPVTDTILYEDNDPTSVLEFEERLYTIDNEYIGTEEDAQAIALTLIADYSEYGSVLELEVKGNPAYQIGDAVDVDIDGYNDTYFITKKVNVMAGGRFIQRLTAKIKEVYTYFILDESLLDGEDVLAP